MASNGDTQRMELPAPREAIIDQAQRIHQEVAHERDMLRRELAEAKTDIAGYKVALEAQSSNIAQLESKMMEATIVRDNAVGRRAELETVLQSIQALLRTFMIGHEPLIKVQAGDEASAHNVGINAAGQFQRPGGLSDTR